MANSYKVYNVVVRLKDQDFYIMRAETSANDAADALSRFLTQFPLYKEDKEYYFIVTSLVGKV